MAGSAKQKDALGYTVMRSYDSAGSLTGITDSVGNTLLKNVTVLYGVKPFVTAATTRPMAHLDV